LVNPPVRRPEALSAFFTTATKLCRTQNTSSYLYQLALGNQIARRLL